jgi:hypothetical protein
MKFDITKEESTFSSLVTGLTTFVMGSLEQHKVNDEALVEEIKKLQESKKLLVQEVEDLKAQLVAIEVPEQKTKERRQ